MFIIISKGLTIVMIMATNVLAKYNINTTIDEYSFYEANIDAIPKLNDSIKSLNSSLYINATLAALMVLGFVVFVC